MSGKEIQQEVGQLPAVFDLVLLEIEGEQQGTCLMYAAKGMPADGLTKGNQKVMLGKDIFFRLHLQSGKQDKLVILFLSRRLTMIHIVQGEQQAGLLPAAFPVGDAGITFIGRGDGLLVGCLQRQKRRPQILSPVPRRQGADGIALSEEFPLRVEAVKHGGMTPVQALTCDVIHIGTAVCDA